MKRCPNCSHLLTIRYNQGKDQKLVVEDCAHCDYTNEYYDEGTRDSL